MSDRRPITPRLLALAAVVAFAGAAARAAESPVGKVIAQVVPVNNKAFANEQILTQMMTRPGKPYDEAVVQEDVRRLLNTKWFAPGGVKVSTAVGTDGRVTVFVEVVELNSIVREVVFLGHQHLSEQELYDLTGVRRGGPLNPAMNQLAAQAVRNKLREDGRYYASVELVEGGNLSDSRVVMRITEGPVVRVKAVEFRGNTAASSGRLRTVILTSGALIPNVVTPLSQKFQPAMMEEDKKKLVEYYHRLGHLEARVREEVVPARDDPAQVSVVYHVLEGPSYQVEAIRIDGNQAFSEDRLRKVTLMKPGERYDRDVVQADLERIKRLYGNGGVNVQAVEGVFAIPDKPGVVNVHYQILEPGREPDRVGTITIEGNNVTADRVILNQIPLLPGQVLQYPRIDEARQNLMRLGIFDMEDPPTVEVIPRDDGSNFKDVRVRVKETRTGMVAVTANVNSDAGVNGSLVVNQRNFDILRVPTSLDDLFGGRAFRGGGQELRLEAMPGTQFQRYAATWREPYLFDSRFGLTTSGYYYNRAFAEYNEDRYGGRATLDYRFAESPIWRASFATRLEGVKVKDVPFWAPPAITDDAGDSTVLGLRLGLNRDTRDSYLLPTSGSVIDLGVEQVLGDYQFPIGTAEYSGFFTLYQRKDGSGKHVLAARSQVAVAGGNAPVFERFYAGGFRSLRGFTFRGVGPYENNLNIGGTFAFLNTLEYQLPVLASDKLWFVAFVDHGTVERNVAIRDYRVSVGAGLRVVVPALGPLPIALDFAYPINKSPWDQRQIFSFYVGWFGGQ
ncbi:MAG TPA: outer membrane protein assembly factor BamA [Fimbriiglobus sp.]|nr:outer membrane protein assembly factor BamA [Fimbriiglobus sp.]